MLNSFFQSFISFIRSARSIKSTKLLKLSRVKLGGEKVRVLYYLQFSKIFRTIKALRTIKIINFLIIGADTFIQIKVMI